VSAATGAGQAEVLDRLAVTLRQEEQAAQERETALAGPRATAALLALLPLGGLALGALLGAQPWRVLVGTSPGRVCLLAGGALWLVGRGWSTMLVRRAERSR
jgi:tight adherence protein B